MTVEPDPRLTAVADAIATAFGDRAPHATESHADQAGTRRVELLTFGDMPRPGLVSFATLGLHRSPLAVPGREGGPGLGVELLGACLPAYPDFQNALATVAFGVMDGDSIFPGQIFTETVAMYYPGLEMEHLLFIDPISWSGRPQPVESAGWACVWLQAVPISEGERRYASAQGPRALIEVLAERGVDVTDLTRRTEI